MAMKIVQRNIHELDDDGMNGKEKHCETVFELFTHSFVKEYILGLQENHSHCRNIRTSTACSLKVSGLVLIEADITPQLS